MYLFFDDEMLEFVAYHASTPVANAAPDSSGFALSIGADDWGLSIGANDWDLNMAADDWSLQVTRD